MIPFLFDYDATFLCLIGAFIAVFRQHLNKQLAIIYFFFFLGTPIALFAKAYVYNKYAFALIILTPVVAWFILLLRLYTNRINIAGLLIIMSGYLSNYLAMLFNDMKMPVALSQATVESLRLDLRYISASINTRLNFLGDWIMISNGNLISLGDIAITAGVYILSLELLYWAMIIDAKPHASA